MPFTIEAKQDPESHDRIFKMSKLPSKLLGKVPQKFQLPDEKQSAVTKAEMISMLELSNKDVKAAITKMLEQSLTLQQMLKWKIEGIKKNQMEILEQ